MHDPVSKKQIEQAKQEARDDISEWTKESRYTKEILERVKNEIRLIEDELGKRTIPYGGGFIYSAPRFRGVPTAILDAKWKVYKDFADSLEIELARPKTRRETLIDIRRATADSP